MFRCIAVLCLCVNKYDKNAFFVGDNIKITYKTLLAMLTKYISFTTILK